MKLIKIRYLFTLLLVLISLNANAAEVFETKVVCTLGSNKRTVKVDFADSKKNPPCTVTYHKATEEPWKQDVLYQADNNSEFCKSRANDLLDRLISWGWKCDGSNTADAGRLPSKIK